MPEKALTEKAKQDAGESEHLWPSIDRFVREVPEDIRQGSQPVSPNGFQMGRAQSESGVVWITAIFMAIFHLGTIAALFFFTWTNLIVAAVLYVLAVNCGIGMGYHRLLVHRGYQVPKAVEYFLSVCGTLALEGGGWRRIASIISTATTQAIRTLRRRVLGGRTWAGSSQAGRLIPRLRPSPITLPI